MIGSMSRGMAQEVHDLDRRPAAPSPSRARRSSSPTTSAGSRFSVSRLRVHEHRPAADRRRSGSPRRRTSGRPRGRPAPGRHVEHEQREVDRRRAARARDRVTRTPTNAGELPLEPRRRTARPTTRSSSRGTRRGSAPRCRRWSAPRAGSSGRREGDPSELDTLDLVRGGLRRAASRSSPRSPSSSAVVAPASRAAPAPATDRTRAPAPRWRRGAAAPASCDRRGVDAEQPARQREQLADRTRSGPCRAGSSRPRSRRRSRRGRTRRRCRRRTSGRAADRGGRAGSRAGPPGAAGASSAGRRAPTGADRTC